MGKSKERQDRMNTWLIGLHQQQKEQKNDEGEYQIKKKKKYAKEASHQETKKYSIIGH